MLNKVAITMLIVGSMNSVVFAQNAHNQRSFGKYVGGQYRAGNNRIIFISAEFQGTFNYQNIHDTFFKAVNYSRSNGRTAATKVDANGDGSGNQQYRLGSDRYAVLGWYNLDRNTYRFFGVKLYNQGRNSRWIDNKGNSATDSGFHHVRSITNGYEVMIAFADDDHRGISWRFEGPR